MCPNSATPQVLFPYLDPNPCAGTDTLSRAPQTEVKGLMTAVFPSESNFYQFGWCYNLATCQKCQSWAAWIRSHHLINPPDLFSFISTEAFLKNCFLNTTTVLKAPGHGWLPWYTFLAIFESSTCKKKNLARLFCLLINPSESVIFSNTMVVFSGKD